MYTRYGALISAIGLFIVAFEKIVDFLIWLVQLAQHYVPTGTVNATSTTPLTSSMVRVHETLGFPMISTMVVMVLGLLGLFYFHDNAIEQRHIIIYGRQGVVWKRSSLQLRHTQAK